jgi:hypothetical protein
LSPAKLRFAVQENLWFSFNVKNHRFLTVFPKPQKSIGFLEVEENSFLNFGTIEILISMLAKLKVLQQ